jgi:hypothetical protein
MGIDIRTMSLWEASACWAGYVQAQGGELENNLSDYEAEELGRWLDS